MVDKKWTIPKFSLNQKISIWGIVIPSIISAVALFKVGMLEVKVSPVIEMKPQITTVINNVTEVKKEIVNLWEMLKQQDALWKNVSFRKQDLNGKVVKITNPDTGNVNRAAFVLIELDEIPLANSIRISTETGTVAAGICQTDRNIVLMRYLRTVDSVLANDTDFINVVYLPDGKTNERLRTLKGITHEFSKEGVRFHFLERA